jgi:hypothetical protein
MSKKGTPVVIVRKDKRLHKGLHLAAFALTGGASGVVTAAKAGTNAGYNARTRRLAAQADEAAPQDDRIDEMSPASLVKNVNEMSLAELKALVTMPNGRTYSYWRHGSFMTARQRVLLGGANGRIARLERAAAPQLDGTPVIPGQPEDTE